MPKKTITKETIVETEEKPVIAEGVIEQPQQEMTPEESDFSEYLGSLGPNANIIKIKKYVNGISQYCGKCETRVLINEGEDFILRKWHGGRYYLEAFMNNKYLPGLSRTMEIYENPESEKSVNQNNGPSSETLLLRDEIQRQHELVLKLLEGQKQPAQSAPTLTDIVAALATMKNLVPQPPALGDVLPGLTGLMKFAKEAVTEGGSGNSFSSIVEGALKAIPLIFGGIQNMRGNGNQPEPTGGEVLTPEQAEKQLLGQAIARLKMEAVSGLDPELCVSWIASHQEDPNYRNMAVILLNRQFETLFDVDSDLGKEPLRSWFFKVYTDLRKVFIDGNVNQDADASAGGVGS
jgi:hypothetical protein